ncbi:MAG: Nif11-like leader peptide family natural product precursor [Thainema sp.]
MTQESAYKFLSDASHDEHLRDKFQHVANGQEFIQTCQSLGYDFTIEELQEVIQENSEGVEVRRKTGVWTWLRQVNWR